MVDARIIVIKHGKLHKLSSAIIFVQVFISADLFESNYEFSWSWL